MKTFLKNAHVTVAWLWGLVWNPRLVWVDGETGEFSHTEKINRFRGPFSRWGMLRPMYFHTIFTKRYACGCRKRFGRFYTMWCMDHSSFALGRESETPQEL